MWLIALGVAYYAGGYVAGRMARFDSGRQGFGVWLTSIVVIIVLAVVAAVFGAGFNLLGQLNLPNIPVGLGGLTIGGVITLVLALAVSLAAAVSGAKVGERYHRKIDDFAAANQTGSSTPTRGATHMQPTFGDRIESNEDKTGRD